MSLPPIPPGCGSWLHSREYDYFGERRQDLYVTMPSGLRGEDTVLVRSRPERIPWVAARCRCAWLDEADTCERKWENGVMLLDRDPDWMRDAKAAREAAQKWREWSIGYKT